MGVYGKNTLTVKDALMLLDVEIPIDLEIFRQFSSSAKRSRDSDAARFRRLRSCGRNSSERRGFREIILRKTYGAVGEMPSEVETEMQMLDTKRMCNGRQK